MKNIEAFEYSIMGEKGPTEKEHRIDYVSFAMISTLSPLQNGWVKVFEALGKDGHLKELVKLTHCACRPVKYLIVDAREEL